MMKKTAFLTLALLASINSSFAYHINISSTGLSASDKFSVMKKTVAGDCKIINGKYNCSVTSSQVEGISFSHMQDYFNLINKSGANQKLAELNIKINGNAFASCQHLEKRGQNFSLKLTPQGCL
jgi:hypothetical protein